MEANENVVIRGKKVKLLLTPDQESLCWQFAGTRRFAYNWALELITSTWKETGVFLDLKTTLHMFVELKKTVADKQWLNNISCDVGKQAIKDLYKAFDRYFKLTKEPNYKTYTDSKIKRSQRTGKELTIYDRNGYPKFKKKLNCDEGFHQDCCQVKIVGNKILLSKIGYVTMAKDDIFPQGSGRTDIKLYNCKVKTDGINWYFVAGVEDTKKVISDKKEQGIGIDLGVKDLAILSDGTKYKNINKTKRVKRLEKRKKRLQRKVSRKYEMNKNGDKYVKTNNSIKLQKQILKITKNLDGIRKNYRHQVTSEIVKREPIFICMEDLNVKGMMKNKYLSKSIQEQGFGYFKTYITYKCDERNIPIYCVDRWYPSSKTCSHCGYIKKDLKLSDRIYNCPNCGISIDRDINAAINLKSKGQEFYNKSINQAQ